jgi:hypothetical protein
MEFVRPRARAGRKAIRRERFDEELPYQDVWWDFLKSTTLSLLQVRKEGKSSW